MKKKTLIKSYNFEVNEEGVIIDYLLNEPLISNETRRPIKLENASLIPGSLKIVDTTPLTISKLLRKRRVKGKW